MTPPHPSSIGRIAVWVVLVAVVDVAWQTLRLRQQDPVLWIICDYASRLSCLSLLALDPVVRGIVYRREPLRIPLLKVVGWSLAASLAIWLGHEIDRAYTGILPTFRLGYYPRLRNWPYFFDMSFGLCLVVIQEELFFRRAMRAALAGFGDGKAMVVISALVFMAHHWWTGVGNMIFTFVFGIATMALYRRLGALWPAMAIHYVADFISFT